MNAHARRRVHLLCTVSALLLASAAGADAPDKQRWGKTQISQEQAPSDVVAKFAAFDQKSRAGGKKQTGFFADTERWAIKPINTVPGQNPYTLVVRVRGTAVADGDVSARWQAGWGLQDGTTRLSLMPELVHKGAKAGQTVDLVGAAAGVSFKDAQSVVPTAEFMAMNNLRMDDVSLETWSGVGKATFLQTFMAYAPAFVGLVMLGLWWLWRAR